MAKVLSTDRGAASSKPGAGGGRVDYAVKGEHGLRLRVTGDKRGGVSRIWSLLYTRKSDNKKCRLTLGEVPRSFAVRGLSPSEPTPKRSVGGQGPCR